MSGTAQHPEDFAAPADARFALVATRFNADIVERLLAGARGALRAHGVAEERIDTVHVPGAWELPLAADRLAASGRYAAIVAMGCVIRGDTRHFEHVADESARGLMRAQLDRGVAVANAVLAVERRADAEARADGAHGNKGADAALAALAMAGLAPVLAGQAA
jgi:6,7-dimethyl-8-ribityllumazine synthase